MLLTKFFLVTDLTMGVNWAVILPPCLVSARYVTFATSKYLLPANKLILTVIPLIVLLLIVLSTIDSFC